MNNNSIYGNGIITIRGTGATSASVSLGVHTGLSGAGSGVANYVTQLRCRICGHVGVYFSYTSMITVCGMCGYRQDDFNRANNSELSAREALNILTDAMTQPGKVEPVEEDKIKETKPMSKFKPGDKVTTIEACCSANIGTVYIVSKSMGIGNDASNECGCEDNWTLVEDKTMLNPLSDLSNLIQRTFSEDTKTLYRAGYLSKDLNITEKLTNAVGEMFVGHIIAEDIDKQTFATFAAELIKRAKEEIAEAEKKEKK